MRGFDPCTPPFERKNSTLYIDGTPVGELATRGELTLPQQTELLIGAARKSMLPVPSGSIHPKDPVWYALEGSLDDLSIYQRGLSAEEIQKSFAARRSRELRSSPWRELPSGPPGEGRFGAFYTTLKFQESWDRLRRIGSDSDVIVRFERSPIRLVFWQGTN
jgi:hypothetical protein